MKKLKKVLLVAGCVAALGLATTSVMAQGRGGNASQRQQQRLDRYHEEFGITDDAEWKVIEPKITKVMDAQREVMTARMSGMFGRGGRGGGAAVTGGAGGTNSTAGGQGGGRRSFFGEPSPEATALQAAIDAKAPSKEIKEKLAKLRDSNKTKDEALTKAEEDLRSVLTSRQEAVAVLGGLLK